MTTLFFNEIYCTSYTHVIVVGIVNRTAQKYRLLYKSNCIEEHCSVALFDGSKFNDIFDIFDMGIEPSVDFSDLDIRERRVSYLLDVATKHLCTFLLVPVPPPSS